MRTNHTNYHNTNYVRMQDTKALQIQTDYGSIKADDKTAYVLIGAAMIVACFFIYMKFGHKHVKQAVAKRKKR